MKTPTDLIDAYLDDSLTDEEAGELRRWLAQDREHLREFVLATYQHQALRTAVVAGQMGIVEGLVTVRRIGEHCSPSGTENGGLTVVASWRSFFISILAKRRWTAGGLVLAALIVATWMLMRDSVPWAPPMIGLPGGGQVAIEDTRFSQQLARWCLSSRFEMVRRLGVSLGSPDARVKIRPGVLIKFSHVFNGVSPTGKADAFPPPSLPLTFANDGTILRLRENSVLKLLASHGGKRFELISGVLEIDAAPQPVNQSLQILTPIASVKVKGTKLSVATSARTTRVMVREGEVSLETRGSWRSTAVLAGERAIASSQKAISRQTSRPITNHFGEGTILREVWTNVPGRFVSDLTASAAYQSAPARREQVSRLEKPESGTTGEDAYGMRYRGYLHPPVSGEYTFWVSADDTGEVWLSTDERPENKRRICQAKEWSRYFHNWWEYPDQESLPIRLERGKRYYIEALHKEGQGDDFFSVAWEPPGADLEIIQGADLSPFAPAEPGKP